MGRDLMDNWILNLGKLTNISMFNSIRLPGQGISALGKGI